MKGKKGFGFGRGTICILLMSMLGFMFVLWVFFFYPKVSDNWAVWQLFLIFYVLVIAFWLTLTIALFGPSMKAFKGGAVLSILSAILDLYYPPFSVNIDGSISAGESIGYKGSIDYTIGYYLQAAGLSGIIVFILTYLVIPILIFMGLLIVLKPSRFKQSMKQASG